MSFAETAETALILPLGPEPTVLSRFRNDHDPAFSMGVPLHVTAIIPFVPKADLSGQVIEAIDHIATNHPVIDGRFDRLGTFPESLHLLPEDPVPFERVIREICAAFPETPPYAGQHDTLHIHATIGAGEALPLDQIRSILPLELRVQRMSLILREGAAWMHFRDFPMRAAR